LTIDGAALLTYATGQDSPRAIAVDADNVYWANTTAVLSAPKTGGGLVTTVAGQQDGPNAITAVDSGVYWTTSPGGTVMCLPAGSKTPKMLTTGVSGVWGIAVFGTNAYVTLIGSNIVLRVPISGVRETANFATRQVSPAGIAADASGVYWANSGGGTVMRAPLDGGPPETLAIDQQTPTYLATDDKAVYWVNTGSGTVMKLAK